MQHHPLELLSPARDISCGVAAINHGADAVYIGGPRFSARSAAGNSLQDIERLVRHAHIFRSRVYVALNTLFHDRELDEAAGLVQNLYDIGVDALIIQDMGLLECDLPPLPLHASTQTNNRTPEKVKFLEQVGFQQVVLARELSLEEIRTIRAQTSVLLECFIHGALCVSYSGQCYISEVVSNRSANRGECAQFCRHKYTLRDDAGNILEKDKYLLSLKDLDLSAHIRQLIDAGVNSFKIEGRLKGVGYVKNVTAFYRQLLDDLLEEDSTFERSSAGRCEFAFPPNTNKSFNRGKTGYFFNTKRNTSGSIHTPKSLGELLGRVERSEKKSFTISTDYTLHNGDGLCYFDSTGTLVGLKANRVEDRTVFHRTKSPPAGTTIYRNHDVEFAGQLERSEQCRFLPVAAFVTETPEGLQCELRDEDGIHSVVELTTTKEQAKRPGMLTAVIERQMRKSGGTLFQVQSVTVNIAENIFLASAVINELRRLAFAKHLDALLQAYKRQECVVEKNEYPWIADKLTYLDNVTNQRAKSFYRRHGVTQFAYQPAGVHAEKDAALMTTRYCIKAQLGICPKISKNGRKVEEPLTLTDNTGAYELEFNCVQCEMIVRKL